MFSRLLCRRLAVRPIPSALTRGLGVGEPPAAVYRPSSCESLLDIKELCRTVVRRRVKREAMVRYLGHRYEVPPRYIGDYVWLYIAEDHMVVKHHRRQISQHRLIRPRGGVA